MATVPEAEVSAAMTDRPVPVAPVPEPRRLRLLLVVSTAHPESVGEAWIAYQWIHRLAERHDVTVLCYRQRAGLPLTGTVPNARVVEWTEPPLIGRHERFKAMLNPGYYPFAWQARRWIRRALAHGERFDLAHQLTPVSLRFASPLARSGIPYVIGPVGGSLDSPPAFADEEGGAPWFTGLRRLDAFRLRHSRGLRATFANAALVVGIADYVREQLGDIRLRAFTTMSDTGIESLPAPAPGSDRTRGVRLLFVGRVIRTKGVRDAVRALALLPRGTATFDVVGDGYDRAACEALAAELGVADLVRFHGRVPHEQVDSFYEQADVFVFPSYREAGGIVVIEALSHGLPVVACDRGGPSSTVTDACGIRVPVTDPEQLARDLADALARLCADPVLRARLAEGARRQSAEVSLWDRRVEHVEELYARVLEA
ncbi:glycosyltransferase family 4 protein [Aeromicrobium tamlense]